MRRWTLPLLVVCGSIAVVAVGAQQVRESRVGRAVAERVLIALEPDELSGRRLETADEMADYLAEHPDRFALAVWEVGHEDAGIFHDADQLWPLASVAKILPLALASEKLATGEWDAGETVPGDRLRDGGVRTLGEALHIMIRHGERVATNTVFLRLGRSAVIEGTARLGPGLLPPHPPHSIVLMAYDGFDGGAAEVGDEAWAIAERLSREQRESVGRLVLPISAQESMVRELDNRGSARAVAKLVERLFTEESSSWTVARALLSWPLAPETRFRFLASAGGSQPGTFTSAYFAETLSGRRRVAALLLHDVPFSTSARLNKTDAHLVLVSALLSDDAWIEKLRARLAAGDGGT